MRVTGKGKYGIEYHPSDPDDKSYKVFYEMDYARDMWYNTHKEQRRRDGSLTFKRIKKINR